MLASVQVRVNSIRVGSQGGPKNLQKKHSGIWHPLDLATPLGYAGPDFRSNLKRTHKYMSQSPFFNFHFFNAVWGRALV